MTVLQTPQEDVIDLFKHCDLPTRCKIRRVCRYWKHIVALPQVNQTVPINFRCILVSNPSVPAGRLPNDASLQVHPKNVCRSQLESLQEGWCPNDNWLGIERRTKKYVNLNDHRRNGLLGGHVRTLIYDGGAEIGDWSTLVEAIQSIGMYCTGVEHIVFWRMARNYELHFRRDNFKPNSRSGLPQPKSVTVVASQLVLGKVDLYWGYHIRIRADIETWTDSGESYNDLLERFVACSPALRAWVAKHAPCLPERYLERLRNSEGIYVDRCNGKTSEMTKYKRMCLISVDYQALDVLLVRALAHYVVSARIPGIEPPPQPFEDGY